MNKRLDTIVIGGGHAGTEAARAAAAAGARTLLLTQNIETIGQLSCNPAIGGIGKSHLVREIDALGGLMARVTDLAGIHFRVLNTRKGAAVRATRAQVDRGLYRRAIQEALLQQENLEVLQQSVEDLLLEGDRVVGVRTQLHVTFMAPCVVLATGTFLGGRLHMGREITTGGRAGEAAALPLAQRLRELPLQVGRMKTGTPPRVDGRSVDWSQLTRQPGDEERPTMSIRSTPADHPAQIPCHLASTTAKTAQIITAASPEAPLFTKQIEGIGPRYCPSIEEKIHRFPDRLTHQVFVEPEGLTTPELYLNGLSTSLPYSVQEAMVQSMAGFEQARLTRPGYAVEYDFLDPQGLKPHLESQHLQGLFLAGQINGTTGYEEAAAQGLLAGLNAARLALGQTPKTLTRDQSYLGVMVDDLRMHGVLEPYRMFTSRSEHRLRLREDNADLRLTPAGREFGLVDDAHWRQFQARQATFNQALAILSQRKVKPGTEEERALAKLGIRLQQATLLADLLRRPEVQIQHLLPYLKDLTLDRNTQLGLETHYKYQGYIQRQERANARLTAQHAQPIPVDFEFDMAGLSHELRQRLKEYRPDSLGEAARLPGMTPAGLALLSVHLKKHQSTTA